MCCNMGEVSTIMRSHKTDLDTGIAGVMPQSWDGHGRLAIRESEHVPMSVEQKAIEKAVELSEKKDITTERAAEAIIKQFAER